MISETPCRAISVKPTGSSSLTGQRTSPPAFDDCSSMRQEFDEPRPGEIDRGSRRSAAGTAGRRGCRSRCGCARRPSRIDEVDADMLVDLERVGPAEQHHAGEHVPLDLEPAIGAFAERVAAETALPALIRQASSTSQLATTPNLAFIQSTARLNLSKASTFPPGAAAFSQNGDLKGIGACVPGMRFLQPSHTFSPARGSVNWKVPGKSDGHRTFGRSADAEIVELACLDARVSRRSRSCAGTLPGAGGGGR